MKFTKKFTEEERVKIVEEVLECGSNSLIVAKYDINPTQISNWKCCYHRYGQTLKLKDHKPLGKPVPDYKKQCAVLTKK